ncbi:MAG: methyltransferase domain-containing protein [Pseudomonadota bacterium]
MHIDVTELRDFYLSPLGIATRSLLRKKLRQQWSDVTGLNIFGVGFAAPFLGAFRGEALRLGALMPASQGVILWPAKGPYQSALVEEQTLPLASSSIDRCIIVHSLEMSESANHLLQEVWRILVPDGHIIVIAPNRHGLWARFDKTPFGYGQPFSRRQLGRRLYHARFSVQKWHHILYMPPFDIKLNLASIEAWEKFGKLCSPAFSGLLMVEAKKEIYAPLPKTGIKIISGLGPLPASSLAGAKTAFKTHEK